MFILVHAIPCPNARAPRRGVAEICYEHSQRLRSRSSEGCEQLKEMQCHRLHIFSAHTVFNFRICLKLKENPSCGRGGIS